MTWAGTEKSELTAAGDWGGRVRKVASFSISLNLELLFCEVFDSKK